jgi:hypothetical protein
MPCTATTFAALMGRPSDVDLQTFVKNGAYYTETAEASVIFGAQNNKEALRRYFNREGVAQPICDILTVRFKPSAMELSISGEAEIGF